MLSITEISPCFFATVAMAGNILHLEGERARRLGKNQPGVITDQGLDPGTK